MSDNLNTTSSVWFLGEKQDFGSADWTRGRRFVDRIIVRSTAAMADSVNRTTNSTWFQSPVNSTETHDVDLLPPITLQDSLGGVLCLGAVLLLVGLVIYFLVRFEKESLQRRRRAMQTNQPIGNKDATTNQRRDAVIEIPEGYIDASELPSDVELGDDDDVFYSSDNDENIPPTDQAALDLSSRVQAARARAEASRKRSVEESRV